MRECSPPQTSHVSFVMYDMSRVTSDMSHVTCHVSHVTCPMSHIIIIFLLLLLFFCQSGEAYRWWVCYQRGLLRLVYTEPWRNFLI